MGCDGGTIPRRDELVRVAKKPEQKDKEAELAFRWRHCAITQQPLQEPIVMCGLGRLYSKQNVIEHLLDKDKMPDSAKHIRSLRDVRQLTMQRNPNYADGDSRADGLVDKRSAPFICKLIGLEMTGKFRFVALWTCGCVFSERALKEINAANVCSLCQQAYSDEDVVTLNGDDTIVEAMLVNMQTRAAKLKVDKKAAKKKSAAAAAALQTADKPQATPSTSDNAGPSTSSTAAPKKSHKDDGHKSKASKASTKRPIEAGASGDNSVMTDPELKRLKNAGDFSVANDPKSSDVYKSLFTSHKSEQEQERAHWVTFNPFYN